MNGAARRRSGFVKLTVVAGTVAAAVTALVVWLPPGGAPAIEAPAVPATAVAPGTDPADPAGVPTAGPIVLEQMPVQPPEAGFPLGSAGEPAGEPAGGPGGGGPGGAQGMAAPADPCATTGGKLAVTPDPLQLPAGTAAGALTIRNCGTQPVDWTAATKPWVTLGAEQGTLAAGATHELGFTVDDSGLLPGPYTFRIKISEPGHNVYVDVNGSAPSGAPTQPPAQPPAQPQPAGCAGSCIVKAWLTPRNGTPDLSLEVRTDTEAKLFVEVSTQPPQLDQHGRPYFPHADVSESTDLKYRTRWDTVLSPLAAGTRHHIIVLAVDRQGHRSSETGAFTTTKPVTDLSAGEAGGCGSNCIASAVVNPKPGSPDVTLTVHTHVPATLALYLDDEDPKTNGAGEPYFPGAPEPVAASDEPRTEWTTELHLEYGTTYRIILRAVDDQSRSQYVTGRFGTAPAPQSSHTNDVLVTFHKIHVSDDADGSQRGEMRFHFEVDGDQRSEIEVGERKVDAPEWIDLDTGDRGQGRSVAVHGASDVLPIRVQAWERDWHNDDFGFEFCSGGSAMFDEVFGRVAVDDCDIDIEWNTAVGAIDLHADTGGGALPECFGMDGITGDICAVLEAGDADPIFTVYVTIDFVE